MKSKKIDLFNSGILVLKSKYFLISFKVKGSSPETSLEIFLALIKSS